MRGLLVAGFVFVSTGVAMAEDGQANWSGFYLGGYVGGAQSSDSMGVSFDGMEIGSVEDVAGAGPTFGVLAGYNHQMDRIVVGVEAEAGLIRVGGSGEGAIMRAPISASLDYMWTGAVRARAGVLATDDVLLYGAAGVAGAYLEGSVEGDFGDLSEAAVRWGWIAGAGVEWAATDSVRLRIEYLRADLGESDYTMDGATATTRSVVESVRGVLIYAF